MKKKELDKRLKYVLIGVVLLQILVMVITLYIVLGKGGGSGGGGSSFPFWLVAIIPVLVAGSQGGKAKKKTPILWFLVGLGLIVLVLMVVFLLLVR